MADTLEHPFNKVCNVFAFDSLNTHQEESIKYIVQEKKETNIYQVLRKRLITPCSGVTSCVTHLVTLILCMLGVYIATP